MGLWLNERVKNLNNKFSYTFKNNNLRLRCNNFDNKFSIAIERKNSEQIELFMTNIKNGIKKTSNEYFSIKPIQSNFNETIYDSSYSEINFLVTLVTGKK